MDIYPRKIINAIYYIIKKKITELYFNYRNKVCLQIVKKNVNYEDTDCEEKCKINIDCEEKCKINLIN